MTQNLTNDSNPAGIVEKLINWTRCANSSLFGGGIDDILKMDFVAKKTFK
jgi:hypothetical protein